MYGPRSTSSASSGYGRGVHHTQPHSSSRAQRYPPYGSSFPNSGAHRYAEAFPTNDQVRTRTEELAVFLSLSCVPPALRSFFLFFFYACRVIQSWYRVEHSDHYPRPNHARDRDVSYYSHSEEGDRHSDVSGGSGIPGPAHSFTSSSRTASPVPAVYREGTHALGSRLFEQLAGDPPSLARATATVTRLDLREEVEDGYEGSYPAPQSHYNNHHLASTSSLHRRPSHRRPSQHAFQVSIRVLLERTCLAEEIS